MFFEPDQQPAYRRNREFDINGASLNVPASADWSFSACVDISLHEARVYKENSLVLIGNDNRFIQNFENSLNTGKPFGLFGYTRSRLPFYGSLSQRMSHRA
jgi:hypothetical protein